MELIHVCDRLIFHKEQPETIEYNTYIYNGNYCGYVYCLRSRHVSPNVVR